MPNLLQTGAGAPCGIMVYEGHLLPKVFQNQIIHTDAGRNVVRAYPVVDDGAGYKARIVNLLDSTRNQWFRPCDVCAAPDGSLFVADWYDPGVGGHAQADTERGRIFRIAPEGEQISGAEIRFHHDRRRDRGPQESLPRRARISPGQSSTQPAWPPSPPSPSS